jgi:hypothetical protein
MLKCPASTRSDEETEFIGQHCRPYLHTYATGTCRLHSYFKSHDKHSANQWTVDVMNSSSVITTDADGIVTATTTNAEDGSTTAAVTYAAGSSSELTVGDNGSVMSVSGAAGAAGATDDGGCASGSGVSTASVIHCTHATSHHGSGASMIAPTVTKTADGILTTLTLCVNGKTIASLAADGTMMLVDRDATQLAAGDVHLRLTVDGPDRCEEPVDQCENMEKKCHSTISTEPVVALTISKDTTSKDIKTTSKDIKTYADMVQGILRGESKVVRRHTGASKVQ